MFRNVSIEYGTDRSLLIRWEWLDNKDGSSPDCRVFYCSIPENKILDKGMFLENEILAYFNSNVVPVFGQARFKKFEEYAQKYPDSGKLISFKRGISDIENRQLPISSDAQNHIFLVCVYDNNEVVFRIISCEREQNIPFREIKPSLLQKLIGRNNSRHAVEILCDDHRKKVIVYRKNKNMIYTVLPENSNVYYFDSNINLAGVRICFLSSLIGRTDIATR